MLYHLNDRPDSGIHDGVQIEDNNVVELNSERGMFEKRSSLA